jgi:hypothetical protein
METIFGVGIHVILHANSINVWKSMKYSEPLNKCINICSTRKVVGKSGRNRAEAIRARACRGKAGGTRLAQEEKRRGSPPERIYVPDSRGHGKRLVFRLFPSERSLHRAPACPECGG